MFLLRHLPNFLTSLNLFLGTVGAFFAITGRPDITVWCILAAALFDFLDGFAARMLNAYSAIGKDMDSLADLISFGLAPAAAYSSLLHFNYTGSWGGEFWTLDTGKQAVLLSPFILTVFSALRLAKFNNDTRQTEEFIGLTTTATGMFTVSFVYLIHTGIEWIQPTASPWFVLPLIALFCGLLVSEIPMFSLKFKSFGFKGNENRYNLLLVSLVAFMLLGAGALAVIIPVYVIYSVILMLVCKK